MSDPVANDVRLPRIPALLSLDAWRGFAALWVVMGHSCIAYMSTDPASLRNPLFHFSSWCQIGVVIFFMLSGYCICGAAYNSITSRKTLGRYFHDRIKRIFPPYLIACVGFIILLKVTLLLQQQLLIPLSNTPPKHLSWQALVANFALVHIPLQLPQLLLVAWSLCYEVAFYLIIGIFLAIGKLWRKGNPTGQVMVLFYGCAAVTVGVLLAQNVPDLELLFPFKLWYQFGLGALLFIITASRDWPVKHRGTFIAVTAGSLVLLLAHAIFTAHPGPGHVGAEAPKVQAFAALIFFGVFFIQRKFDVSISKQGFLKPLMWVGTFSYSLYLVHAPLIAFPDAGLRRLGFSGDKYIVAFLGQILISVLGGWIFYHVVEKRFISVRQAKRIEADFAEGVKSQA